MTEKLKAPEINNPVEKLKNETLKIMENIASLKNLFVVDNKVGSSDTVKFLEELKSQFRA